MSPITPVGPGYGSSFEPEQFRQQEAELERRAERYSRLHGGDDEDEVERPPGIVARMLGRLTRRPRD